MIKDRQETTGAQIANRYRKIDKIFVLSEEVANILAGDIYARASLALLEGMAKSITIRFRNL